MKKKSLISIYAFSLMGFCMAAIYPAYAEEWASENQPRIFEAYFDESELEAGERAVVKASVSGGTIDKLTSLSCELWVVDKSGTKQLWMRDISGIFTLPAEGSISQEAECFLPDTLPEANATLKLILANEKGYQFDYREFPVSVKGAGSPVVLSEAKWLLESWNPPNPKDALIEMLLNHYVGKQPRVSVKVGNTAVLNRDVFFKVKTKLIGGGADESVDGSAISLIKGESKDLELLLPEIKEPGIYNATIQLFDSKTLSPASNIITGRYIAKEKIGASFMDILDVSLDKSSYLAGETAILRVALEGSKTYVQDGIDIDISAKIIDDGEIIATENGSGSLEDDVFERSISVNKDFASPLVSVKIAKGGVTLSEYEAGKPAEIAADVKTDPIAFEEVEEKKDESVFLWITIFIAIILILFLVWKYRSRNMVWIFFPIFFTLSGIFFAQSASAYTIVTEYSIDSMSWSSPLGPSAPTVNFRGGLWHNYTPYGGGYLISSIKFFISSDVDIPTYNCGGRRCLNTASQPITLLGSVGPYGLQGSPQWNKTFDIPTGFDTSNGVRFWIELLGTYKRWHPDAMDASYMENSRCWVIAYQRLGNNAQYISQTVPATMTVGQTYPISITMKNNGYTTWTTAKNYNLGSQNPQDNTTWGLSRVSVGSDVSTNSSKTFSFNVTAPVTPGNYNFRWRMIQEGKEWFGDYTPNVLVAVKQPVTIGGSVKDEKGNGIPNAVLDLCGAGTATTDSSGNWAKSIFLGDSYCVRISSGLPAGYNFIHGVSNNTCHTNAATYEYQVAGQNKFVKCSYSDQRSWDLAGDSALDFLVNYCDCGAWSNAACGAGSCGPLQREQTRICNPLNCLAQTQCVNDIACCVCGAWSDDDCELGGCPANQMRQVRTCNVSGCNIESQCVASAVCPRTLTVSVAASPVSAQAPLTTAITGTVGGTAVGTINYTTWWDCDDPCATVSACQASCGAWDDKADGQAAVTRTINHTYAAAGTFHPKMIVERHNLAAAGTVAVTAINGPPSATALLKQADYCGSGLSTMFSWTYSDPENDPQVFRQVQVDNNADFSSPADDTGKAAASSTSYVTLASKLGYDIVYHWRVKVWDSWGNDSGWVNGPDFSTPLHAYPAIDFSSTPAPPKATELITYTDLTQVFGGATIVSRSWEIDGANPNTSVAESPAVTYAVKGDYVTKLTVTDSNGYTCSLQKDITVNSSLPDWEEL
ncbi:MAG TPA: PKD domain-containing protein [Candidatus Paceibacterota bacterium]|nr:PKD domain-containing protein [Candidatus Pacearchaeota archaeon]HRZ50420.1 PKD domain-containing protein [Candidatus Paceibacterota bacterium]HSA36141.1 PKD domain-containing protein [Candidatus Paceibacterota bacterium]